VAGRLVGIGLNRRNARTVKAAVDATGTGAGASVADIGFGGGVGLSLLLDRVGPSGTVHGVEISKDMLAAARRRYAAEVSARRLALHAGSLQHLPLADSSMDGLVTTNTVYFVDDLGEVFAEMARVLTPTGRAVIGVADPEAMAQMPFTPYGFRLREISELLDSARDAGLELRSHERVGDGPRPSQILVLNRRCPVE
jgi:ubiquinone/menaquinone biosynthesis C-methylase UbiE